MQIHVSPESCRVHHCVSNSFKQCRTLYLGGKVRNVEKIMLRMSLILMKWFDFRQNTPNYSKSIHEIALRELFSKAQISFRKTHYRIIKTLEILLFLLLETSA